MNDAVVQSQSIAQKQNNLWISNANVVTVTIQPRDGVVLGKLSNKPKYCYHFDVISHLQKDLYITSLEREREELRAELSLLRARYDIQTDMMIKMNAQTLLPVDTRQD